MGIVETVNWRFRCPPDKAAELLTSAFDALGMEPVREGNVVSGRAARSMRKNRWAAKLEAQISPTGDDSSRVRLTIDMAGDKHTAMMGEISSELPDGILDDVGVTAALDALGKAARLFGRKEIKHLRSVLDDGERVEAVGQGRYKKRQGLVVLTDQRLFFFEKGAIRERIEQFALSAITSISERVGMSGEQLAVHASGNDAEITHLAPGDAARITERFRALKTQQGSGALPVAAAPVATPASDPFEQIERLGQLRDSGLISAEEYETKKTELLNRL